MQDYGRFEHRYRDVFERLGSYQQSFPLRAKQQMGEMLEESARRSSNFGDIASKNHTTAQKGGWAAEQAQAETYNHEAILKGSDNRGFTDNDLGFSGAKNDQSSDVAVQDPTGKVKHSAQAKVYETSKQTAKEMGKVDQETGSPKYQNEDSLIGPKDQVHSKDGNSIQDKAREQRLWDENKRPNVAKAKGDVEEKATDRLSTDDGVEAKGFDKEEYRNLGEQNEKGKKTRDDYLAEYRTRSTVQQMGKATAGAFAITAVTAGVYNSLIYAQAVRERRMTTDEAALRVAVETGSSATDCAVKAAANTGAQSLMKRYAAQAAAPTYVSMFRMGAVTTAVISIIDLSKNLVLLSAGEISQRDFEERSGKTFFNTGAGVYGSAVGASVGSLFPPFGIYVGSVAGGMSGAIAMQFAIENGIEKPFRETIEDTQAVRDSVAELEKISGNILDTQVFFENFVKEEARLTKSFEEQQNQIEDLGRQMKNSVDKI